MFYNSDTIVSLVNVSNEETILDCIEITNLLKESGDPYASKAELVTALADLFNSGNGGSGTDPNAIHINTASEIHGLTEKVTLHNDDEDVIEDSQAIPTAYVKKRVKWSTRLSQWGDAVLSVTGLKTFDKDKLSMKGTSTGVTTLSTANASANNYTWVWPAKSDTAAGLTDLVNAGYDATVGIGGNYDTITLAIAAGKKRLKQIGIITEAGAIGTGTYDVIIYGDASSLITLGAGIGSRILFVNCLVSITGNINGNYTFEKCNASFDGGTGSNSVRFVNGCIINHNSGNGISAALVIGCTINLVGNSAYMSYVTNSLINLVSGNGYIYSGIFVNCYSSHVITLVQCTMTSTHFVNGVIVTSSAGRVINSTIKTVTINSSNYDISHSTITNTVTFSANAGSNCKLIGNIITELVTLNASCQANIICFNTLTGGLTDNSGSTTNIIKDNL